ncbi:MAG: hypothetical protein ISR65_17245 [Bacteriovoracaceae bacterium]|nr:hypothetical protein [Bacteriovoracaceae bacterium]
MRCYLGNGKNKIKLILVLVVLLFTTSVQVFASATLFSVEEFSREYGNDAFISVGCPKDTRDRHYRCGTVGTLATPEDLQPLSAKIAINANKFSNYATNDSLKIYAKTKDLETFATKSSLSAYLRDEDAKKQYATKDDISIVEKNKNILADELKTSIEAAKSDVIITAQEKAQQLSDIALTVATEEAKRLSDAALEEAKKITEAAEQIQTNALNTASAEIGQLKAMIATLQEKLTACPRKCLDSIPSTQQEVREKAECLHNGLNLWETNQKAIEKRCVVDLVLMQLELAHKHATKLTTEQMVRIEDLLDRYPYYRPIDRGPLL